jgi:hypothetical protein
MPRILLTLLAANFLVFMWLRGAFDSYLTGARDPDRLNQQVDAERLRVASASRAQPTPAGKPTVSTPGAVPVPGAGSPVAADSSNANPGLNSGAANATPAPASAPASATASAPGSNTGTGTESRPAAAPNAPTLPLTLDANLLACSELAPLDELLLARARKFFADNSAYFVTEVDAIDEPPSFLVYSVPSEDLAAAQRKFVDFKRQGFEGITVITEGPRRFGMSFGTVRSEALAKAMVDSLTRRGVRSLRIDGRDPNAVRTVIRFRYQAGDQGLPTEVSKELQSLSTELGLKPVSCVARAAGRPAVKP